jgi:hypothetical protein
MMSCARLRRFAPIAALSLAILAIGPTLAQAPRVAFTVTTSTDLVQPDPARQIVQDFNQDGHLDLLATTRLFTGNGTGLLSPAGGFFFAFPSAVASADFNGDGYPDVVATQDLANKQSFYGDICGSTIGIGLFLGPDFASSRCIATMQRVVAVQTGDFNGDGRPEIAVVSANASGLWIYSGHYFDAPYTVQITNVPGGGVQASSMAPPIDLNGDGNLDLVVGHSTGVTTFLGNGDGTFTSGGTAASNATAAVAVGSLNGDAYPDLAWVESGANGRLRVGVGASSNTFSVQTIATVTTPTPGLTDLSITDIDHDGRADIVVADKGNGVIQIYFGNGDGTFAVNPPLPLTVKPNLLVAADWNEDGRRDLAILDSGAGGLNALAWMALQNGSAPADTTAPVVTLTSPAAAGTVSGRLGVTAAASDNVGVTHVDFYADGTLIAKSAGPLFMVSWNTAAWPNAPATLTAWAYDAAGNFTMSPSVYVTVANAPVPDTVPPILTVPSDMVVEATGADGAVVTYIVTATDNVDGNVTPTCEPATGSIVPLDYTNTVTCTATDAQGNTASASFTVIVRDTTAPTVAGHDEVTTEATSRAGATVSYMSPATTDAVDGSGTASCAPASGAAFPVGDTLVTCDATDRAGNRAVPSRFTIHVVDRTAPTLTVPGNAVLEATGPAGAPHLFVATAIDVVDGPIAPTCVPGSGSIFPVGTTTVGCAATDAHGNTTTAAFTVTVRDTMPPLVTAPAAVTVAATEAAGARGNIPTSLESQRVQAFVAGGSAVDLHDVAPMREAPQAAIGDAIVAVAADTRFPIGTTTVTFRYRDASGNVGSAASSVTVTPPVGGVVDTADHAITATNAENVPQPVAASFAGVTQPGLLTAEPILTPPTAPPGFAFVGPVYDVVTTALVVPPIDVCLLGAFPADGQVVQYASGAWRDVPATTSPTAMCAAVQALSPLAVITATDHAPSADAGPSQTVEATSAAGALVTLTGRGADPDAGDTLTFRWTEGATELGASAALVVPLGLGAHAVTLTVTDNHGLSAFADIVVIVRDTTAPLIAFHDDFIVEASSSAGATVSYMSPATTDAVDGSGTASCAPASGAAFPVGDTLVTCDATDRAGNRAVPSRFTIHVVDRTAPTLTVPGNAVLEATGPAGAPHLFVATAIDVVDGPIAPTCVPGSGSIFPVGTTTVGCAATDAHGNTTTAAFTVTVRDTMPPLVTAPAAVTVAATEAAGARGNIPTSLESQRVQAFVAGGSAVDLHDVAPMREAPQAAIGDAIVAVAADTRFPIGTTTVTFRYRDASGNVGSAASSVTVTPPVGGVVDTADHAITATNAENVPQPVAASFAGVTQPGLLTAEPILTPPTAPPGFAFVGPVYDVVTTALVVPPIDVCLLGAFPADGQVVQYASGAWRDVPATTSPTAMCAAVQALSPLAVITATDHAPSADAGPSQTVEATSAAGALVTLTGRGADPDAGDTLTFRWTEGATELGASAALVVPLGLGAHAVTLTVTDNHGLSAFADIVVIVRDTTAPLIAFHDDFIVEASSSAGATVIYTSPATVDAVDGVRTASCVPASGMLFPIGDTLVTCTAHHAAGNQATPTTFSIYVIDITEP